MQPKGTTAKQLWDLLKTTGEKKQADEALTGALKSMHEWNGTGYTVHSSSARFSRLGMGQATWLSVPEGERQIWRSAALGLNEEQESWWENHSPRDQMPRKEQRSWPTPGALKEQLAVLGVEDAWDPKVADFSALYGRGKGTLHLGSVVHWAFLELASESGGEDGTSEDEHVEKPKLFYADHSFIVLVKEYSMGLCCCWVH